MKSVKLSLIVLLSMYAKQVHTAPYVITEQEKSQLAQFIRTLDEKIAVRDAEKVAQMDAMYRKSYRDYTAAYWTNVISESFPPSPQAEIQEMQHLTKCTDKEIAGACGTMYKMKRNGLADVKKPFSTACKRRWHFENAWKLLTASE